MIDWEIITLKDFAGYVSEELKKRSKDTVLVGGACTVQTSLGIIKLHLPAIALNTA